MSLRKRRAFRRHHLGIGDWTESKKVVEYGRGRPDAVDKNLKAYDEVK